MAKRNSTGRASPTPKPPVRLVCAIDPQRRILFEAHAIIEVSRYALESLHEGLDKITVIDALSVASRLIDGVASAMADQGASRASNADSERGANRC